MSLFYTHRIRLSLFGGWGLSIDNKIMINNTSSISVAGQKIRPPGRNIPNDSMVYILKVRRVLYSGQ